MSTFKKVALFCAVACLSAFAQQKINPSTQVQWTVLPYSNLILTGTGTPKQLSGARYADQWQSSPGSNNGIAMSLADCLSYTYACQVVAPALYSQTENAPYSTFWGPVQGPNQTGPKSSDPLGCFIDNRWAAPQYTCNEGLAYGGSSSRFQMAPWGITQNALTMGPDNAAHNIAALIQNTQWMGAYDYPGGLGSESTMEGLRINTFDYSMANNDPLVINANSWSPHDTVAQYVFGYGVGTTLGQNEGTEVRSRLGETGNVTQVTLSAAPTCGVTCTMAGTQTQGTAGAYGEELPWIDLNKSYSTGYVSGITYAGVITGSGTNWDSAYGTSNGVTTTTAAIGTNATFPLANVTIPVTSSSGFTTGAAFRFDQTGTGDLKWEGFHITSVPDGTHIVVDQINYPIPSGATISQGGLAGYGFKMDADDVCAANGNGMDTAGADSPVVGCIHNLVPIVSNASGNVVTLFNNAAYYDFGGFTRAYLSMGGSGGTASVTVSGGAVTACTASGGSGYISAQNPPQLVISGITYTTAPQIYVSGVSGGALTGCTVASGGSGISGTPSVAVVTSNPYHIYPMSEALQNYNATTGRMDGSAMVTTPWTGTVSSGDVLEQEHYFWNKSWSGSALNSVVNNWQYGGGPAMAVVLSGRWNQGFNFNNLQDPSLYLNTPQSAPYTIGRGQIVRAPAGYTLTGPFSTGLSMTYPPPAGVYGSTPVTGAVTVGCKPYCGSWTQGYNVLDVQNNNSSQSGEDALQYNPSTQTWNLTAGALSSSGYNAPCGFQFGPNGMRTNNPGSVGYNPTCLSPISSNQETMGATSGGWMDLGIWTMAAYSRMSTLDIRLLTTGYSGGGSLSGLASATQIVAKSSGGFQGVASNGAYFITSGAPSVSQVELIPNGTTGYNVWVLLPAGARGAYSVMISPADTWTSLNVTGVPTIGAGAVAATGIPGVGAADGTVLATASIGSVYGNVNLAPLPTPSAGPYLNTDALAGTLAASTQYFYKVAYCTSAATTSCSAAGPETSVTTGSGATNENIVSVNSTVDGVGYAMVCRSTTSGAEQVLAYLKSPATTYVDNGTATPSGACPSANTSQGLLEVNGAAAMTACGTATTVAATTPTTVNVTGFTTTGHVSITPTNSTAATLLKGGYYVTKASGVISLNWQGTVAGGETFDVNCSLQ